MRENKNHIREWFVIKLMPKKKKLKKVMRKKRKKEKENVKDIIDYQDR